MQPLEYGVPAGRLTLSGEINNFYGNFLYQSPTAAQKEQSEAQVEIKLTVSPDYNEALTAEQYSRR